MGASAKRSVSTARSGGSPSPFVAGRSIPSTAKSQRNLLIRPPSAGSVALARCVPNTDERRRGLGAEPAVASMTSGGRGLTWDQGAEMTQRARRRIDTGVAVYFCDPHSSWQRGTNENTNDRRRRFTDRPRAAPPGLSEGHGSERAQRQRPRGRCPHPQPGFVETANFRADFGAG